MPDEEVMEVEQRGEKDNPDNQELTKVSSDDSPPDLTPPISTDEKESDSADSPPDFVVKRGKGRPRADGLPNKTAVHAPPPTPRPQYRRFYSDALNANQKPSAFFRWYHEIPSWSKERLTVYVYRNWPVLKQIEEGEDGKRTDVKYIDKLAAPPKDVNELQDRYGAGDYQMIVNDDVQDKITVAELYIREGFRDIARHPPTDRRIDNVDNVDLDDPMNKSYIQYLRGKGKLPEQQAAKGREADMAEATALKEMTGLVRDVIAAKKDDRGTNDTTATVVKEIMGVMGEVNKQAASVMENAYKKTQESSAPAAPPVDPLETLTRVLAVVKELKGNESGPDSEVVKLLLNQMNKQQERLEELFKEVRNSNTGTAATAPAIPPLDPLNTTKQTLEAVMAIATTMGLKAPGAAAALMSAETGSWWKDNLPEIMQYGSQAIGAIANAFTTKMQIDARQAAMTNGVQPLPQQPSNLYVMPPPAQPAAPPLQPSNLDGQQPDPPATADPALAPPTPEQQQELDRFYALMSAMHRPLMNHINKALGGDRFAEWLIDSREDGDAVYLQIKQAGAENMVAALRMYEPLWRDLESKQDLLPRFIDEFINMEEIRAQEEENQDEDDEGEEAEAEAVN